MAFSGLSGPHRTPSPTADAEAELDTPKIALDSSALDPQYSESFDGSSYSPQLSSGGLSPYPDAIPTIVEDASLTTKNPFGFKPVQYTAGPGSPTRSGFAKRQGHKYKHSSVSHQIFLEPTPKAPLQIPASLPIPSTREGWKSMSREQTLRLAWGFCHLLVAGTVQWNARGSLAATALSHLIFYDAICACLSAGIDVLSNFEAWKRSSIRHPFGLERMEVLVGFGNSILLLFMGFDLISHNAGHFLEEKGNHEAHRAHNHGIPSHHSITLISALAIVGTLVSALMFKNHARIAKSMRISSIAFLPSILSNPSHLLTLSCSAALLIMPLVSFKMFRTMDQAFSLAIGAFMCLLGVQLVKNLGSMLLMSYQGGSISDVLRAIEIEASVKAVEESKFWQVHYGLCMASLKLRVRAASESDIFQLRQRINRLIKDRLGGGYGSGGQRWEVTIQMMVEID